MSIASLATSPTEEAGNGWSRANGEGRELGPTRSPGPHLLQCTQSASGLGRKAAAPVNERNRQGLGSLPPMCALSVIPK